MTRSKRTLAEVGSNAESAPIAKRASTGKKVEKENKVPNASDKDPKSSTKKKAASKITDSAAIPKDKEGRVPLKADGKIWICICRPIEDIAQANEVDEDDGDAIEELQTCGGGEKCICRKPANDYPEHQWIMTKKGFEMTLKWQMEQAKRDQDNFDMYIFNDWSGYGTVEVMENILLAFDKEFKKKIKDPLAIWSQIEGLAMFLNGDMQLWESIDDSEGNAKLVSVIGVAILSTLDFLIEGGLFENDSMTIRNIGLMLCHFLKFAHTVYDTCQSNENGWAVAIIKLAEKHNVAIQGMAGIDETAESLRDGLDCDDEDSEEEEEGDNSAATVKKPKKAWNLEDDLTGNGENRMWRSWDWKLEFGRYCKAQGGKVTSNGPSGSRVGGNHYDLTAKHNKGSHMKRHRLG